MQVSVALSCLPAKATIKLAFNTSNVLKDQGSELSYATIVMNMHGGGTSRRKIFAMRYFEAVYFACTTEFAVGNFAPTCCEPTFGWWWLLLFADALPFSPRVLLFLSDELLVRRGGLLFLLRGVLQINSWKAAVNSWWLAIDC